MTDQAISNDVEKNEIPMTVPVIGKYWKTRIFSFVALLGMVAVGGIFIREVFYVMHDGFVAPFVLSPDNDLVIQNNLKLAEIEMEKAHDLSIKEGSEAAIKSGEKALLKLEEFKNVGVKALLYPTTTTYQQSSSSDLDISKLDQEHITLSDMNARQQILVKQAKANFEAGLIQKPDYEKEIQSLDQIHLASTENERNKIEIELLSFQAKLEQSSLRTDRHGNKLPAPEIVMSEYELTLIENQILQTQAVMLGARAEKNRVSKELSDIDALETLIMSRPIFKAINANIDAIFIPYSQLEGLREGDPVYDCVLALVHCKNIGTVDKIISGEIILPDPFTNTQTRGQYATLNIFNKNSMLSKILRVRGKVSWKN